LLDIIIVSLALIIILSGVAISMYMCTRTLQNDLNHANEIIKKQDAEIRELNILIKKLRANFVPFEPQKWM
jgi:cell division protein FtsL